MEYEKMYSVRRNTIDFEVITAGVPVEVFHRLDRPPTKILPVLTEEGGNVKIISRDAEKITVTADVAGKYKIMVFK